MKSLLSALSYLAMMLVVGGASSQAFAAGGMEGGGGKSVVCRNPDGTIRTAEVLDLYESRTVFGLPYQESPVPWRRQAIEIFEASGIRTDIGQTPPSSIYDWFQNASSHLHFLPDGTSLKPIDDSLEVIVPKGCLIEQTANYQNDRRILVSTEIWNALSETQRAALLIHEAAYRHLRAEGEKDSRRARHFTAHIVSGNKIEEVSPAMEGQLQCEGGDRGTRTSFFVIKLPANSPGEPERLRMQFDYFGGRRLLSKSYKDMSLLALEGYPEPPINILDQLKQPSQWFLMQGHVLDSLFESGDLFNLLFQPGKDGKWVIELTGTSAVDGSTLVPTTITCR